MFNNPMEMKGWLKWLLKIYLMLHIWWLKLVMINNDFMVKIKIFKW